MLGAWPGSRVNGHACRFHYLASHWQHLRQSEIQNLCVPALGDEDIGRLDVTVDDALRMCGIHGIGNFDSERQHHLDVQWFAGDPVLQCHAIQKLHGNESLTIFLTDIVNRANILMIQSRRRLRFALESG